jgi:hypothetical protein
LPSIFSVVCKWSEQDLKSSAAVYVLATSS